MPTFFFSRPFKIYTNFWPENKSSGNPCTKHERAMAALLKYQIELATASFQNIRLTC
jgi:hypothetical protein